MQSSVCYDRARSQMQNQGIFQKRSIYSVEGRKPENQYNKAELAAQE